MVVNHATWSEIKGFPRGTLKDSLRNIESRTGGAGTDMTPGSQQLYFNLLYINFCIRSHLRKRFPCFKKFESHKRLSPTTKKRSAITLSPS